MYITEFFLLVLERNMISNRHGIEIFYTAFKEACGSDGDYLDRSKFHYAIILLAQALFSGEENPHETMFSKMLVDSLMTSDMKRKLPPAADLTCNSYGRQSAQDGRRHHGNFVRGGAHRLPELP